MKFTEAHHFLILRQVKKLTRRVLQCLQWLNQSSTINTFLVFPLVVPFIHMFHDGKLFNSSITPFSGKVLGVETSFNWGIGNVFCFSNYSLPQNSLIDSLILSFCSPSPIWFFFFHSFRISWRQLKYYYPCHLSHHLVCLAMFHCNYTSWMSNVLSVGCL